MATATKAPRKPAPAAPEPAGKFQASCELDAAVHSKVEAFRAEMEELTGIRVSFAAALRKIVNDWADKR